MKIEVKKEDVARLMVMTYWRDSDPYWEVESPVLDGASPYNNLLGPSVNDKRPYGNGYIIGDIHEILKTEPNHYDEDEEIPVFSKEQNDYAIACHRAMTNAFNSMCRPKNLEVFMNLIDLDHDVFSREISTERGRFRGYEVYES